MSRRTAAPLFPTWQNDGTAPFGLSPEDPAPRDPRTVGKEFLKVMEEMAYNSRLSDTMRNWANACAYSLALDIASSVTAKGDEAGEKWFAALKAKRDSWHSVMDSTNKNWRKLSKKCLELMAEGLESVQGDFLSEVFERGAEATNTANGQFLTPVNLSRMIGRIAFPEQGRLIKPGIIVEINEPCCGTGVLICEGVREFLEAGGRKEDVAVVATDIDEGACCTCYLQLASLWIPAIVQPMDTLRMKVLGPAMITPAYVLFNIHARLEVQKRLKTMLDVLHDVEKKAKEKKAAGVPAEATETAEATATPPESQDAPAASVEPRATPPKGVPSCERGTAPDGMAGKRFLESGQGVLF